jgi:hypothetical protein
MKIFGLEIRPNHDANGTVVIRSVTPEKTTPVSKIPSVKIATLSYAQQFARGRGVFNSAEYDLSEIGIVEDTDSFVRQAFKKKEGLMFKEGVGVQGSNKDTVQYYKTRMAQIAKATNIPTTRLLKSLGRSLIRTSNAYLIKVRDEKASGGKVRTTADGKRLKPIAGYFPAAPEMMQVSIDPKTNRVLEWAQMLPDGNYKTFKPEDVVHFTIDRREGFFFGIPTLIPVIDDIRALRQIEENIELLLYQHLFPLFHYKVGTVDAPAGYMEDGTKEVDAVEAQIKLMPAEGCLVTPERHEITAIGAEGRALRADGYLTHFKKRVYAGLGVSQVDLGDGDCYDEKTQTLTRTGWKYHTEIDHTKEEIATFNPDTQRIEFHLPNYKYEGIYHGDMICFNSRYLDIKVSPHHEMWVKPRVGAGREESSFEKISALDLYLGNYCKEFYMLESAPFEEKDSIIDLLQIGDTAYSIDKFARLLG